MRDGGAVEVLAHQGLGRLARPQPGPPGAARAPARPRRPPATGPLKKIVFQTLNQVRNFMSHVKIQHVLYVKTLIFKEIENIKKKFLKKGLGEKEKSISKMKKKS